MNGVKYRFQIKRYDSGLSPSTAVRNVRKAIADGAVAIVDEGTGVDASWQIARDKDIPLAVTYQGGEGLIDPASGRTSSASRRPTTAWRSASPST